MKRSLALILGAMAALAVFGGLVYAVMVVTRVAEPGATTVYGLTLRRLWATTVALVGLCGAITGRLSLTRPTSRVGNASGRLGATAAVVAGLIATANGGLNLALADGGPGTGNGVVGGAAAFVLGLISLGLGGVAFARRRGAGFQARQIA